LQIVRAIFYYRWSSHFLADVRCGRFELARNPDGQAFAREPVDDASERPCHRVCGSDQIDDNETHQLAPLALAVGR